MLRRPAPRLPITTATLLPAALAAGVLLLTGCGSEDPDRTPTGTSTGTPTGTSTGTSTGTPTGTPTGTSCTPGGPGTTEPGPCDPDPLRTDLPPLWNDMQVDVYDCPILEFTATYNEPDAMIFKAMIYVESRFTYDAVGCTDRGPCCSEIGWTAEECMCLGVMQNGPSCGEYSGLGLLPDGHVNMETDPNCAEFNNSIFNPVVNIEIGISRVARNRERMQDNFPGCTEDQYTMMAVGEYHSYQSTQSCTVYNFSYDSAVLEAYNEYSAAAGWPARPYVAQ